jgi:hypothetical protein
MKIVKIADGAFFVPSYSEQTILRSYTTETSVQSFGLGDDSDERKEKLLQEKRDQEPIFLPDDTSDDSPLGSRS